VTSNDQEVERRGKSQKTIKLTVFFKRVRTRITIVWDRSNLLKYLERKLISLIKRK